MKRKRKRHPNTSKIDYYNYGDLVEGLRGLGVSYTHIAYILSHRRGMKDTFEWKCIRRWCGRNNLV